MIVREAGTVIFLIMMALVGVIAVADYAMEKKSSDLIEDDTALEEFIEDILENKTGIKIDLTPDSKEK